MRLGDLSHLSDYDSKENVIRIRDIIENNNVCLFCSFNRGQSTISKEKLSNILHILIIVLTSAIMANYSDQRFRDGY